MRNLILLIFLVSSLSSFSQSVTITNTGITPNQGGVQKLTYDQIRQLPNSQEGDLAYDLTFNCLRHYNGVEWLCVTQENSLIPNAAIVKLLSSSNVEPTGLELDSEENIIIIGAFNGTVNFGTTSLTSLNSDMFMAKYDKQGNEIWALQEGESSISQVLPTQIVLDLSDNIYVAGSFSGTSKFGVYSFSPSNTNIFLVKYNPSGLPQIVRSYNSGGLATVTSLSVDISQNVYFAGKFDTSVTLGSSTFTKSGNDVDGFIAKQNSNGTIGWSHHIICTNEDPIIQLAADLVGNVYLAVSHINQFTFLSTNYFSSGGRDFKLFKLNSSGAFQWVEAMSGTGNQSIYGLKTYGNDVVIIGGHSSSFIFLSQPISSLNSSLSFHYFIIRLTGTNRVLDWQKVIHSTLNFSDFILDLDAIGNVYVCQSFKGQLEADPFNLQSTTPGFNDVSYLKIAGNNGEILEAKSLGGFNSDYVWGLQVRNANGKAFLGTDHTSSFFLATEKIPANSLSVIVLD